MDLTNTLTATGAATAASAASAVPLFALLLSMERFFYGFVWWRPQTAKRVFKLQNGREPERIFDFVCGFKLVQAVVFAAWWYLNFGMSGFDVAAVPTHLWMAAAALMAMGQTLNMFVWKRLGVEGVCYGIRYGRSVPWCTQFPYDVMNSPQYIGAILTVWGLFLPTSTQAPTQWFIIPAIETLLYSLSIHVLEA